MSEVIKAEDYGLAPEKANELTSTLEIVKEERKLLVDEFKVVSKLEVTEENIPKFKELRLRVAKNRTQGINKWHKVNKEFFLTGGKFVDAIKRKEILVNEEMEERLMEAEKHFENLEINRLKELQTERANLISEYVEDAHERDLSSMEIDVWNAYFKVKKQSHIDRKQAELDAEEERQAEIAKEKAESERIAAENERLRAEQAKKDKIQKIRSHELQPYIVFIRDYNGLINMSEHDYQKELKDIKEGAVRQREFEKNQERLLNLHNVRKDALLGVWKFVPSINREDDFSKYTDKEFKERLDYSTKLFEEDEKNQKEKDAKIQKERDERKKVEEKARIEREELQAELKRKNDAEQAELERIEKEKQAELSKGDAAKVRDLLRDLDELQTKYTFKSARNQKMYSDVSTLIDKVKGHITK